MAKKYDEREFDPRIIPHLQRAGVFDEKAYQEYLKSLSDSEGQGEYIDVEPDKPSPDLEETEEEPDKLTFSAVES